MITIKRFEELTNNDLYDIFESRIKVFVVEQNCPYQDIDELDKICFHVMLRDDSNNKILAYSRVIFKDDYAVIGRVISTVRSKGYGLEVVNKSIEFIKEKGYKLIEIEAQEYALGFYEKAGFKAYGDTFLMDNIPHKRMKLILK